MLPGSIAFYGASSCYGVGDPDGGGYVVRFRQWYSKFRENAVVYNLGIPAENSESLVERFADENQRRNPDLIIFHLGTNDACRYGLGEENAVSLEKFSQNAAYLFAEALKDAAVGVISSFPVDESTNPHGLNKQKPSSYYLNADLAKYRDELTSVASGFNIPVLDLFGEWFQDDRYQEYLTKDGLHANQFGHIEIVSMLKSFVTKNFDQF